MLRNILRTSHNQSFLKILPIASTRAIAPRQTHIRNMSSWNEFLTSSTFGYFQTTLLASSGIVALVSGILYWKQNDLIYPANIPDNSRTNVPTPDQFNVKRWREVSMRTPDGETLKNYFIQAPDEIAKNITVIMFHGNAGNIGHRVPIAKVFAERMGANVFMLGYRGYGRSTGSPSEKGFNIDAQTALDWLQQEEETKNTKIVIYGQSIGGALAIQLAAKNQNVLSGLVLENTFLSMRSLIPTVFPPARYIASLCHQLWASDTSMPKINKIPILFLSGLKDDLVPPLHMKMLYQLSNSPNKVWREYATGTHNDTVMAKRYFEDVDEFLFDEVKAKSQ